ncbi:MAG: hypothetical protein IKE91_07050 [Clostridia bacterium]|nr:hypothetical protein [Clostridia bacterium]
MKTINKIISLIALLSIIFGALVLTGCGKKNDNKPTLVGVWKMEEEKYKEFGYKFNEDGTGSYLINESELPFSYQDKGDRLVITYSNQVEAEVEYRIEGDILIVKEKYGELRYKKQ